jgi:hypothetical protein
LAGCIDKNTSPLPTYSASGVVKFSDGQPLANATIFCDSPQGFAARAQTDAEGRFEFGTFDEADGAVEGKHRVAIVPQVVRGGDSKSNPRLAVPDRYLAADTSGIEFEITPDGPNTFEFVLERKL